MVNRVKLKKKLWVKVSVSAFQPLVHSLVLANRGRMENADLKCSNDEHFTWHNVLPTGYLMKVKTINK